MDDKLGKELKKVVKNNLNLMLMFQNVIRGVISPCGICVGCEAKNGRRVPCDCYRVEEGEKFF